MQPELMFKAVSYALMELLGIALLCIFVISVRKEYGRGEPVSGVLWFGLAIVCICALVAHLAGLPTAMTFQEISNRVETVRFMNRPDRHDYSASAQSGSGEINN